MATRPLNASVLTEIQQSKVRPVYLLELDFLTPIRLNTRNYDITSGGDVYLGNGWFQRWGKVEDTQNVKAKGMIVELTGIPSTLVSAGLGAGNTITDFNFYLAFVDANGGLIGTAYQIFKGFIDIIEFNDDGEEPTMEIAAVPKFSDFRANEFRYTKDSQQLFDATDEGFDFVPQLQKTIKWGPQPKRRDKKKKRRGRDSGDGEVFDVIDDFFGFA